MDTVAEYLTRAPNIFIFHFLFETSTELKYQEKRKIQGLYTLWHHKVNFVQEQLLCVFIIYFFLLHVHYSSFMQQYSPTWPANHSTAGCIWQKNKTKPTKWNCLWGDEGVGGQPNYYINTWNTRDDVSLCPGVLGWWVGGWGFTTAPLHEPLSLFIHLTFSRGWWRRWWTGVARLISCSGSCRHSVSTLTNLPISWLSRSGASSQKWPD